MRRDQADIAMVIVLTSWSRELWPHLPVWTALQLELLDQGGDLVVGLYEPLPRPAVHRGQAHWAWGGGVKNLLLSLCSTVVIQYSIVQYTSYSTVILTVVHEGVLQLGAGEANGAEVVEHHAGGARVDLTNERSVL